MSKNRRRFSPDYKFRVALEAAKGQQTFSELAANTAYIPTRSANGNGNCWKVEPMCSARNGDKEAQTRRQNSPNYTSR